MTEEKYQLLRAPEDERKILCQPWYLKIAVNLIYKICNLYVRCYGIINISCSKNNNTSNNNSELCYK